CARGGVYYYGSGYAFDYW
nr:immunoglobulin heavy chain junction region [Macaca mulatta]MOV39211.1 immunoglobulin heavy chain junction region [Macaca mulatta]MOV40122.1 immunoglobulin heavy chain junction region [Macaca mulatta]MOV40328.1 immunoglobulin heavy chain junction region [Macaca mulatta]MOV41090.1 immunoglobulin heavy chain junction region [Macaca mulatta]